MRVTLFPFQEQALADLHEKIDQAHLVLSDKNPQVISFSAPTGAGKTIIMTALFEDIVHGHAMGVAEPDSVIVWLSDMPELNEQTRLKIESKSDKFRTGDLRMIDASFDSEYLEGGRIYFLNTQKLGTDKLLTQKRDRRQYTIWETLANTAMRQPKSFYVIIDEAHRGTYTSVQAENRAQSIMQKFIKGSQEDGLPVMPLVIGVTATPQRFQNLIADTTSTIQKVIVSPEDVRESGLLKDRVIIHYPEITINAEMTMFNEAVDNWKLKYEQWAAYCEQEKIEKPVKPILVVQVEDGNEHQITQTDLGACVDALEESLGRKLQAGEVVHTFNDHETITVRDLDIHRIDASRIEENETVLAVFFKMNLSTGWDCPRAETMMSFRRANDYTYIAQLLGRMVRTPLARRVESNAELNDVGLFLPHFDKQTVADVDKALREGETTVPAETGSHQQLVTLIRNPAFSDIFSDLDLVTYRVDSGRKQPALRRLIALARALTHDMISPDARKNALTNVLDEFDKEITALRDSGTFADIEKAVTGFALRTFTIDYTDETATQDENSAGLVTLSDFDLTRLFQRAGKTIGEGLHLEYWQRHIKRDAHDVKTEIIVLANDPGSMERLEAFAESQFNALYDKFRPAFSKLNEERKDVYRKLAMSSATPIALDWELPESIDFTLGEHTETYDRHLFIPVDGTDFRVSLNSWESNLMNEELGNGAVAWLRNLDRKKWSLAIPYEVSGVTKSMYPDLVIVRSGSHGYLVDVLEPHDPSRKDNYPKAVGLAKFAEKHGERFGRIQLIREQRGPDGANHFYRLDMSKTAIRNRVRGITSNEELDRIFEDLAERED